MDSDTLLVTLMSLGFDFDSCRLAIAEGMSSVESAVEWLLEKSNDQEMPTSTQNEVESSVEPSNNMSNNPVDQVVSRYATSESQKKAERDFDQRQRDSVQRENKKLKVMDKEARKQILQQFKEDRDMTNIRMTVGTSQHGGRSNVVDNPSACSSNAEKCNLKIRLANGQNIVEVCDCNETLLNIIVRVKHQYDESHDDVDIIQPFPHKKFSSDDLERSLTELGLTPSGCLVLKNRVNTQVQTNPQQFANSRQANVQENIENMAGPPQLNPHDIIGERPGEDVEGDVLIEGLNVLGVDPIRDDRQHSWGAGVSLGRRGFNPHAIDPIVQAHSPAEAAVSRFLAHPQQVEQPKLPKDTPGQDVSSLMDICTKDIARRLPGHQHPVGSLGNISHRMCQKLLRHLMRKKTLTPKTLKYFIPCQLQQLMLDHYLYVTNDLFHVLRYFRSLTYLSVQSCTVFTDKALEAIAGIKKIIFLDFSNCTQLTNKCLNHLKSLENLETLKLDNTKVSDQGLCDLFAGPGLDNLLHLSLNKTDINNDTLRALKDKNKLKELNIEQTNVSDLEPLTNMTKLMYLNVGGTNITDQSLAALNHHPFLTKLNLHQTNITDDGLHHLKDLQLKELRLPGRLNITDMGIHHIQDLPLTALDLTDYVNITDEALKSIGRMFSLSRLLLSKTKISDTGIVYLSGLCDLKELDLERTAIGDVALDVLSYFDKMEELNLSGTNITDDCLISGKLNSFRQLCKLNLSRTDISDRGIENLRLPSLILVNLDWTRTSENCVERLLMGCPQIKALRRQNCRLGN